MTDLIGTPLTILAAVILYIVCTTLITRYAISGGKSTKEIIDSNKLKAKKARDFLNKYPEANIKTGRNFALAFGFIFAFATSIYAFSLVGERQNVIVFDPINIDSAAVIQIQPPITTETKVVIKNVPPPPPSHPTPEIKIVEKLPEIDEPKVVEVTKVPENVIIEIPDPIEDQTEQPFFMIVEKMPKFAGCEGLDEEEADQCTRLKVKNFLNAMDYPEKAERYDIEGKVYVSFIVGKNGNIENVEILRSDDKAFNDDVVKRIKKMPKFASPGKQRGKSVKVKYSTSIHFKLN